MTSKAKPGQGDNGLVVPKVLLRGYPNTLTSLAVCKYQCFQKFRSACGCSGSYETIKGVPLLRSTVAEITKALSEPCFVAIPDFFASSGAYASTLLLPEIQLLYAITSLGKVKSPGLRVEARVDSFLDHIHFGCAVGTPVPVDDAGPRPCDRPCVLAAPDKNNDGYKGCSISAILKMWGKEPKALLASYTSIKMKHFLKTIAVREIWFGVETADEELLRAYCKKITVDQAVRATAKAKKYGLTVGWYLVVSEKDTQDSLLKTTCLVQQCRPDKVYVSSLDDGQHHIYTQTMLRQLRKAVKAALKAKKGKAG